MVSGEEQRFRLIAGLGNPGGEYSRTRHNAGFMAADAIEKSLSGKFVEKKINGGILKEGRCRGGYLWIAKPMTFMNLSGECIYSFMVKKELEAGNLLLIYDDMDLPLGRIRFCMGGGSAGHKGVESVIGSLGSADFARLRIGIGRKTDNPDKKDYVLSEFDERESELFIKVIDMTAEAVKLLLHRGIEKTMNEYNGRMLGDEAGDGGDEK
ncbi:MAG: aminoacyl-tRNA hydrolase [Lentisphaerae bacterium GWF2_49_21]|nr:MAG: aminoacyl-tRNA hydrolase [Lentisphaerae bacterium GWF2_49_21]